jgi:signal transduction histidine kinase
MLERIRDAPAFVARAGFAALTIAALGAAEPATAPATDAASDLQGKLAEARRLHMTDSTRSRELAEEALVLARARGDRESEATALVEHAIALRRQNLNSRAVQDIRQALALVESMSSRPLFRRTLKEAGHTFWAFGDEPNATDYFQRALRAAEEDGDVGGQADAEAGLGAVASDLKDAALARMHKERALQLAEKVGDPERVALYASNLGTTRFEDNDYVGARQLYERALQIFQQLDQRTNAADVRADLARIDQAEGKLAAAEKTLRELLPARRRLRGRIKVTATLVQLATVLRLQGKPDEALRFLNEASGYAAQLASSNKITVLEALAATHEARGDLAAALGALRQRQQEVDAQNREAAQARAAEVRETFAAERREAEITQLRNAQFARATELRTKEADLRARQAELERARWQRYGLISALACGVVTLAALVSRHRLKARIARQSLEEARAAQHAAEDADHVKTRFLGVASHDIRGPLGNIINLTAELRAEAVKDELHAERCDLIAVEAQRVICLVEDLITTAALDAGKLELRLAPMDLSETARHVIETLRRQAEVKRQTIVFPDPVFGEGRVVGDASRLQQVVANLVSNAIKFSPPGETILMELARTDGHVSLSVQDRGAGIAPDDLPRLFTPFERLGTTPTAGESSHGLGLSIAQDIARRHGGDIRVESQPGLGAKFTLELPVNGQS